MQRREVLACGCIALSGVLSGCWTDPGGSSGDATTNPPDEGTDGGTPAREPTTGTAGRFDPVEDVAVVLDNRTDAEATVDLLVSGPDEPILEADYGVGPGERLSVDPRITDPGEYEVSISVDDGPSTTASFDVEGYDLREGSNLIAVIEATDVRVLIQE